MDDRQRVVWSEGLFLTPQHLQQAERHLDAQRRHAVRFARPLVHGVSEVELDPDALLAGTVLLRRCRAVLPDGQAIDVPQLDAPPVARDVGEHMEATSDKLGVYLALPVARPGMPSVSAQGSLDGRATRWRHHTVEVTDETSGGGERRELLTAVKNLRILFAGETHDDHVVLKVAEITRGVTGELQTVEQYVPPCLEIAASPFLLGTLRRLLEILGSRASEVTQQRRQRDTGLIDVTTSDAAIFQFLHTLNGALPALQHLNGQPRAHPEQLYLALATLAGQLYTFAAEGHPRDLPAYDHENLYATFSRLSSEIQRLVGTVIATRCVSIPLERGRDTIFRGTIPDDRLLTDASFYVAAQANVPKEKLVNEFAIKAKVSSRDRVEQLIRQAMRGLSVTHVAVPPSEIPVQPGRVYYQVERGGDHWEAIKRSHSIAVYLPPEFAELQLELLAVRDGGS